MQCYKKTKILFLNGKKYERLCREKNYNFLIFFFEIFLSTFDKISQL